MSRSTCGKETNSQNHQTKSAHARPNKHKSHFNGINPIKHNIPNKLFKSININFSGLPKKLHAEHFAEHKDGQSGPSVHGAAKNNDTQGTHNRCNKGRIRNASKARFTTTCKTQNR